MEDAYSAVDPGLQAEESDDDFHYAEVDVMSDDEGDDGASEDLDAALRSLQAFTNKNAPEQSPSVMQPAAPGQTTKKPEVMDDFLRNFFVKMGLSRTCEMFEAEWYEMKATGRLEGSQLVPDIYQRNAVRSHSGRGNNSCMLFQEKRATMSSRSYGAESEDVPT